MYEDGDGVEKDILSAADLYLKASKTEHSSACINVSLWNMIIWYDLIRYGKIGYVQ
jgi:TPR repeat protein